MRRLFSRLNPHVQAVSGWVGLVGTVVSAFYTVLSRGIALFGHPNWSESILLGIALTLATGLAIVTMMLVAAVAYRLWKMLPTAATLPPEPGTAPELPPKDYTAEMAELSADMASLTKGYGARLHALDTEAMRLGAVSDATRAMLKEAQTVFFDGLKELRESGAEALIEQHAFQDRMEKWVGRLRDDLERRCDNIDAGMVAIFDRERLTLLASQIVLLGEELSGPTERGEALDDWKEWQCKETEWRTKIDNWSLLADSYRTGAYSRVHATPEGQYRGKWTFTDDMFPGSDAIHAYKTFRIMLRAFEGEREHVDRCVQMAAFAHPSKKSRLMSASEGPQLYLPPREP